MGYAEKAMKRDARGMIVPQVWNPALDNGEGDFEVLTGSDGSYNAKTVRYVVEESFSGNGNLSMTFDSAMFGIVVANDHSSDLTLIIHGKGRIIKGGEVYEGHFRPFSSIEIVASGPWRAETLQQFGVSAEVIPPDTEPPENVTGLSASQITSSGATLTWTASVSVDVVAYEILRNGELIATVTSTTYLATGLLPQTSYTFTVRARDAAGNVSSGVSIPVVTAEESGGDPPQNVTNLAASDITQTGLTLTWTASASADVVGYDVYRNGNFLETVPVTRYDAAGLQAGTSYNFSVRTRDSAGRVSAGVSINVTTEPESGGGGDYVDDDSLIFFAENPSNASTIPEPNQYFTGTTPFTVCITARMTVSGSNAASMLLSRFVLGGSENVMKIEFTWQNRFAANLYGTKQDGVTGFFPVASSAETYADLEKFYHVAFVREPSAIKLYVDNVLVAQASVEPTDIVRQTSSLPLTIGQNGRATQFKNIAYYNRLLSAAELTQNYNALR